MKIVLIGPFGVPGAGLLPRLLTSEPPGLSESGLVYDHHESRMRALTDHAEVAMAEHGDIALSLRVGSTGFGTVIAEIEVDDREELHRLEAELTERINPLIAEHFGPGETSLDGYPTGRVLWWHRVLVDPGEDEPRALRVFGEPFRATDTADGCVANGFSSLRDPTPALIAEVVRGLTAATEDWLLIDELSRRLRQSLTYTRGDDEVLGHALVEAEQLTEEIALVSLLLDERRRHLANAAQRVHQAACRVWDLVDARESLLRNAESVSGLIRIEHGRRSARFDARRNSLLFGFTVITLLQSALLIADFASASSMSLTSPVRVGIAVAVTVATLGVLALYVREGAREVDAPTVEVPLRNSALPRRG